MDRLDAELKGALATRAAQTAGQGAHPDPELLAAYHAGELAADQESRLQDHLVYCHECMTLLLGLEDLVQPEPAAATERDTERDWEAIQARLPPPPALRPPLRFEPSRWLPGHLQNRLLSGIAASLLMATLGLSAWVANLRHTVAELSEPQINAVIRDLYLADSPRGSEGTEFNQIPVGAELVTLILHSSQASDYPDYLLVIEDLDGIEVWRRQGLRRNRWDTFTLVLPGGFLPSGDYRLRLLGLGGDRWDQIEDFPLRVLGS